jgi:predicted nucleotidyltransferase
LQRSSYGVDIEGLLRSLNDHRVRYVLIGAVAFPVYGYARATLDVDIFIQATSENAARVRTALIEFGYDLSDVTVEELVTKKVLIRQYVLEVDIHPHAKGVSFDDVWRNRTEDRIGDTPVAFASLDDLIRMKEAAGRPKDMEDLRVLRRLREQAEG